MKAFLYNYRQAPRKVRLVAGLVRGKKVDAALAELNFLAKRAGEPIQKMLKSAIANAKQMGIESDNLYIKEFTVDKGVTLKRMMPAAMGTGHRINKRTSNLALILGEKVAPVKRTKKTVKEAVVKEAIEAKPKKTVKAKAKKAE